MKNTFKTVASTLLTNWSPLLWFEVVFRFIWVYAFYPLYQFLLNGAYKIAGIYYVSQYNIFLIFKTPVTFLILFCILLFFAYFVYFEMCAIILCCEKGWRGEKISSLKLWKNAFFKSLRLFHYKNFPLFLLFLPLLGISLFGITSSFLANFRVPDFILSFIQDHTLLLLAYIAVFILVNIAVFRYIFSIPSLIIADESISSSFKTNKRLLKGQTKKVALELILCLLICLFAAVLIAAVVILILIVNSKVFYSAENARFIFRLQFANWRDIGLAVTSIFTASVSWSILVTLFHQLRADRKPEIMPAPKDNSAYRHIKEGAVIVCSIVLLTVFSGSEMSGIMSLSSSSETKVIAHRAGATFAPENTISALEGAIEAGSYMAEIDVQQLGDGTLIVMHDTNFKRTAGVNLNVWDTDLAEAKTLDVGSSYSHAFENERVPTLEDMLAAAKDQIGVMIELKSTKHTTNLEEKTIELIYQYQMEQQCVIASMDLNILKRVKELDPSIKTVYISTHLLSNFYNLSYVDGYSVRTSYLTPEIVVLAHLQNKDIYAWTANTRQSINKILQYQADGIITDNPRLAHYYLNASGQSSLLNYILKIFYPEPA